MDLNDNATNRDSGNRLNHTSLAPFPIPVELLHEIVLIYLAASFWNLVAEPGLEKNWDPLSPLLHASVLFREVTMDILRNIIGPPFVDAQAKNAKKYHDVLAQLKRLKTLAESGDPRQLLDPELTELATTLSPLPAANSPLLWRTGELAVSSLHLRLYECHEISSDVNRRINQMVTQWMFLKAMRCSVKTSNSVYQAILRPIQEKYMSRQHLFQKLCGLVTICGEMQRLLFVLAGVPTEVMLAQQPALDEILNRTAESNGQVDKSILLGLELGWDVPALPIPDAILESLKFYKVLYVSRVPEDRPHDDPFVGFCQRVRELLFSYLQEDQKETALLRVDQLRVEAEAPIDWDDVDDFIYNYTDSGSDDEGLGLD